MRQFINYCKQITGQVIVRYLISGAMAATVDLLTLYLLTSGLGVWYLPSSVAAFCVALVVSFVLQKFWTFRNRSRRRFYSQATTYFLIALTNLGINTLIIYFLVDFLKLFYLLGQVIAGLVVAMWSFFSYRHLVFFEPKYERRCLDSYLQ